MEWLDHTYANSPFIDVLSIIGIIFGGIIAMIGAFYLHDLRHLPYGWPRKARYIALIAYGIYSSLLEFSAIGEPRVWWRLPLFFIAGSFALWGLLGDEWQTTYRKRASAVDRADGWDNPRPGDETK